MSSSLYNKYYFILLSTMLVSPAVAVSFDQILPSESKLIITIINVSLILSLILLFIVSVLRLRRTRQLLQSSKERLRLSLWGSGDEMWDWNIQTGVLHRSNAKSTSMYCHISDHDFPPNHAEIHPQDLPKVTEQLQRHIEGKQDFYEATYRIKHYTLDWIWVLDRGKIVDYDHNGKPLRMAGTIKNIHQLKRDQERLYLFAHCMDNISDAVVIYNDSFNIVDVNKSYTQLTGKSRESAINTPFTIFEFDQNQINSLKRELLQCGNWSSEIQERTLHGDLIHVKLKLDTILDEDKEIVYFVGIFSDITERKATEAELLRLSFTDNTTGLPNRAQFYRDMHVVVDKNIHHALLVFDLDNFKKINDSLGHQPGDELLTLVSDRMQSLKSHHKKIYRLGGDEFAIVIQNTNDIHTITTAAKSILDLINIPFSLENNHDEIVVTGSIGIVLFPEDGENLEILLKNADIAMYHAKKEKNSYQFFNDAMNQKVVKRLQTEYMIRHGLKNDFFTVHYQPKIQINTGKIVGMEALVRFYSPTRGFISPAQFIPIAEDTGQIIEIGEVVLRKACLDIKHWIDKYNFSGRVAVNLSAKQFSLPDLCERIDNILQDTGVSPRYLELEITEGTVMDSPKDAIAMMHDLRSKGIHLAMDDFGTGYSSLAFLKQFPLNTLKIDKAFIDDLHTDEGQNMVDTILTIAHNLHLTVVAEGVEQLEQIDKLLELNCELVQGYYYSKPLDAESFEAFLVKYQNSPQIQEAI